MYQLIVKPRAIKMVAEAYQWYEEQQTGSGDLFLRELDHCYDKLEAWPETCAILKVDIRHSVLRKFPYVVIFEILKDSVIVYSVFNTSQNPRKKFRKG